MYGLAGSVFPFFLLCWGAWNSCKGIKCPER